ALFRLDHSCNRVPDCRRKLVAASDRGCNAGRNLCSCNSRRGGVPARTLLRIRRLRCPGPTIISARPLLPKPAWIVLLASLLEAPRVQRCVGRGIDDHCAGSKIYVVSKMTFSKLTGNALLISFMFVAVSLCPAQSGLPASVANQASRIVPPSPSFHFPDNETLVYSVEWHLLNAGTATVTLK